MILLLTVAFMLLVVIVTAYLTRHYLFTLAALYDTQKRPSPKSDQTVFEPTVSVLIPAHNEEHVIERILQRMTELTYPKEKFEVIVIDDASTDRTGEKAKTFANNRSFIHFVQRNKGEKENLKL